MAHTDDMARQVDAALLEVARCQMDDLVVMVAGSPPGTPVSLAAGASCSWHFTVHPDCLTTVACPYGLAG